MRECGTEATVDVKVEPVINIWDQTSRDLSWKWL